MPGAACLPKRRAGVQAAERAAEAGDLARAAARPPVAALQERLRARHRAGRCYLRETPGPVPAPSLLECALKVVLRWVRHGWARVNERRACRFGSAQSIPQVCRALQKAAYDPRVCGVLLKISPLSVRPMRLLGKVFFEYNAASEVFGVYIALVLQQGAVDERRSAGRACKSCGSTWPSSGRAASSPWRS